MPVPEFLYRTSDLPCHGRRQHPDTACHQPAADSWRQCGEASQRYHGRQVQRHRGQRSDLGDLQAGSVRRDHDDYREAGSAGGCAGAVESSAYHQPVFAAAEAGMDQGATGAAAGERGSAAVRQAQSSTFGN